MQHFSLKTRSLYLPDGYEFHDPTYIVNYAIHSLSIGEVDFLQRLRVFQLLCSPLWTPQPATAADDLAILEYISRMQKVSKRKFLLLFATFSLIVILFFYSSERTLQLSCYSAKSTS